MEIISLLISLISGAAGGNIAGAAMPDKSLGTLGNTIAGLLGGGAGTFLMQAIGLLNQASANGLDISSIIGDIASGGVGGGVLMTIIGLIKKASAKA